MPSARRPSGTSQPSLRYRGFTSASTRCMESWKATVTPRWLPHRLPQHPSSLELHYNGVIRQLEAEGAVLERHLAGFARERIVHRRLRGIAVGRRDRDLCALRDELPPRTCVPERLLAPDQQIHGSAGLLHGNGSDTFPRG